MEGGKLPSAPGPEMMAFRSEWTSAPADSMFSTGSPALPSRAQTFGTGTVSAATAPVAASTVTACTVVPWGRAVPRAETASGVPVGPAS